MIIVICNSLNALVHSKYIRRKYETDIGIIVMVEGAHCFWLVWSFPDKGINLNINCILLASIGRANVGVSKSRLPVTELFYIKQQKEENLKNSRASLMKRKKDRGWESAIRMRNNT